MKFDDGLPGFGVSQTKLPVLTGLVRDSGFLDLIPGSVASGDIPAGFWRDQSLAGMFHDGNMK